MNYELFFVSLQPKPKQKWQNKITTHVADRASNSRWTIPTVIFNPRRWRWRRLYWVP